MYKLNQNSTPRISTRIGKTLVGIEPDKIEIFIDDILDCFDKDLKDYSESGHPYVLEWEIVEGSEKGRKINQNLFIHHEDEKKKKRGLLIMAVLYTIAGKDIKTISGAPKVEELAKIICNKKMQIKIETKDTKKIMEDGEEKVFKNSFVNGISKIETKKVIDEDGDDIPM